LSGKIDLTTSHVATLSLVTKRGHPFYLSFTDKAMIRAVNDFKDLSIFLFSQSKILDTDFFSEIIFRKDHRKV